MQDSKCINPLVDELVRSLSPSLREDFEERAGIMEFDGRKSRECAEALALLDVLKRHPGSLMKIHLFSMSRDGITRYLLCSRGGMTEERLVSLGYDDVTELQLEETLMDQFNGLAMLSRP